MQAVGASSENKSDLCNLFVLVIPGEYFGTYY